MKEHSIKIETTAHYYSLGELNKDTKKIWIVCHGYGQLAKFFIQKFKSLQKEGIYIVAPEGFNKFYLKGFSGRVGASWMTKEKRNDEIIDHCMFLDQIIDELISEAHENCKLNVLGFSQGTATISRWSLKTKHHIDSLTLWGGKIANDFDFDAYNLKHPETKNFVVFGTEDVFYTSDAVREYKPELNKLNAEWLSYKGGHTIETESLNKINATIV